MAAIKRLSISDLKQRKKELEATRKIIGNRPYIRDELSAISAELKCRYNPSAVMPERAYHG